MQAPATHGPYGTGRIWALILRTEELKDFSAAGQDPICIVRIILCIGRGDERRFGETKGWL